MHAVMLAWDIDDSQRLDRNPGPVGVLRRGSCFRDYGSARVAAIKAVFWIYISRTITWEFFWTGGLSSSSDLLLLRKLRQR